MVDVFHFLITCNELSHCSCASLLVLICQFDNGWQKKIHLNIRTFGLTRSLIVAMNTQ